jgi:hypothetical protein
VTVLSKVASAALILPISEAIGQLKWSWFHGQESKDAFDFEIFDKASRGAWGSVLLLFRTKGRSLAALGALLTVMLLAIDTFFQQVTSLPERWTLRGEALMPRVLRYDPDLVYAYQSNQGDTPIAVANQDLKGALTPLFYDKNGTSRGHNSSQSDFPLTCPTSVCSWKPYQTLGVCSACADVSNLLTYACLPMTMDWIRSSTGPSTEHTYPNGKSVSPFLHKSDAAKFMEISTHCSQRTKLTFSPKGTACGYFINATSASPVLMSGFRVDASSNFTYGETLTMRTIPLYRNPSRQTLHGGSINFKHISKPILDAFIVSSADGSPSSVYRKEMPIAHECMLAWCVKTLRSSYSWGSYEEIVEETFFNTTELPNPWSTVYLADIDGTITDYLGNISIYPPDMSREGQGYGVSNDTMMDTVFSFDEVFPSAITVMDPTAIPYLKVKTSFVDRVMYRAVRFSPWLAPNNITHHMERIANAVTNVIRSDTSSQEFVAGQAFAPETYVQVKWAWLIFPLVMLILCFIFLIATIVKTSRHTDEDIGVWKTSAMPTLIYGLPHDMRKDLATAPTWHGMGSGDGAKKVKIRLRPDLGWRVSGQMSPTVHRRNDTRIPPGWI